MKSNNGCEMDEHAKIREEIVESARRSSAILMQYEIIPLKKRVEELEARIRKLEKEQEASQ